jgi:hypothetical protein
MEQRNSTSGGGAGLVDRVKASAASQLGAQKDRATDGIGTVADAVRQSSRQLRDQQHDAIAQYIEQAADQLERFATTLKDRNIGDLARDAQDLARRRPALFIGSAFALGLLGARFMKSSNENGHARHVSASPGAAYTSPATSAGRL